MEKYINSLIRGFKKIFNKKYFAILSVFIGVVTVLGFSYGFLASESGWQLAAQLRIRKLYYSIAVNGTATNEISIPANSGTTYYNVEITSLNDINTRYALAYRVSGTATVKVSSASTNAGSGIIGLYSTGTNTEKKKTIKLAITNTSSSTATVTLSVAGGYTWNPEGQVSLATGYTLVSGIYSESRIGLGLTFAEEIDTILNCTPTASAPCYYTNNSNNYVEYAGHTWRILGTYLVSSKPVVKLILNEPLTNKVTYANVSSALTTFYNGLSDTSLIQGSATSLTKAEYDAIGGVNSYLYTKPDKDYWTGTQYYVGTSRGAVNKNSSYTAYVRPVIQLKAEVVNSSSSISTTSVSTLVTNGSFDDYERSSSNLSWNSSLNPNPPYVASGWSNGYNSGVSSPTTGYHAHFNEADFGYLTAKFPDLNTQYGYAHRWLGIVQSLATGAIVAGHKYYLAMDVYSDTVGTGNYSILHYSDTTVASFAAYISTSSTINKWSKYSDIQTASSSTSTSNPYTLYLYGHNGTSEGTTHIRDVLLVDLTNTFGANNEPSQAWCDANIPFFEGTTTVTSRGDILGTITNPYQLALGVKLNFVNMEDGGTNLKAGYYVGGRTYTLNYPTSKIPNNSFGSWSVSGTGASISGTTFVMGTAETTLTVTWIPKKIVTYNCNGGGGTTPNPKRVAVGGPADLTPRCEGAYSVTPGTSGSVKYQSGWSTTSGGSAVSSYTVTDNVTLYAVYGSNLFTYSGSYNVINDGSGNWTVEFKTTGTTTLTVNKAFSANVHVVGGGGGGGGTSLINYSAGGGGGGRTKTCTLSLATGSHTIVIGTGGSGGSGVNGGSAGVASSFDGDSCSAAGGGGGGAAERWRGGSGGNGGSGGGTGSTGRGSATGTGGSNGGNGSFGTCNSGDCSNTTVGTGQGTTTKDFGTGTLRAGGGGGGSREGYASGGPGGGGDGGYSAGAGSNGTDYYGGGGGGGSHNGSTTAGGGRGGCGIVLIRNAR